MGFLSDGGELSEALRFNFAEKSNGISVVNIAFPSGVSIA
jgi:hypothetical protein